MDFASEWRWQLFRGGKDSAGYRSRGALGAPRSAILLAESPRRLVPRAKCLGASLADYAWGRKAARRRRIELGGSGKSKAYSAGHVLAYVYPATAGRLRVWDPWLLEEDRLDCLAFQYRVTP